MSRATQGSATLPDPSRKGLSPAAAVLSRTFRSDPSCDGAALLPRTRLDACGLGCSPFARRYWGNHCCFLFLQVLRCFSSLRMPPPTWRMPGLQPGGLSHSEIRGSQAICAYPRLIAACHVLHRRREPRHPPYALTYFLSPRRPKPPDEYTFGCTRHNSAHAPSRHKCLVYLVCLFHSMPKIACLFRIFADWLRRSAFSQTWWRITDSNR